MVGSSLVPRSSPSFPLPAVQLSGRGPGTLSHVSDVAVEVSFAGPVSVTSPQLSATGGGKLGFSVLLNSDCIGTAADARVEVPIAA